MCNNELFSDNRSLSNQKQLKGQPLKLAKTFVNYEALIKNNHKSKLKLGQLHLLSKKSISKFFDHYVYCINNFLNTYSQGFSVAA